MAWSTDTSHWWALGVAAVTGFLGWRIKAAQDSGRLQRLREDVAYLKEEMRTYQAETSARIGATEIKEARIETRLDSIIETLAEIRMELLGKVGR